MPRADDMKCCFCNNYVEDLNHITIDDNGEIICMCNRCYDVARNFFEEVSK